ncbi:MAG: oxidoreductase, partial [Pseudomonadota bacterium]|nr:oxidoreductase [Pseudomonadota bacterium]
GTTMKAAGSRAAFYRVDFDYVKNLAALAAAQGVGQFLMVTAVGADPDSVFFYSRAKGRIEQVIVALPFRSIHILRPSLLLGPRREPRLGEELLKPAARLLSPLLLGPWRRYRPVHADSVARLMVRLAGHDQPGIHIHYPSCRQNG